MTYATVEELVASGGISTIDPGEPDDIYIAAASFEPRSTVLTRSLGESYACSRAFVYVNEDFLTSGATSAVQGALDDLMLQLRSRSVSLELIRGSWEDAGKQVRALRDAFASIQPPPDVRRITIDATTFNRESLLVCLALLHSHFPAAGVRLLYVAPEKHGKWLTRGYRKVRNVVGFAGVQQPSRSTVLIVLSGFEGDRTVKIIEEYEPKRVLLGIGDPPTVPSFLERNVGEHKLVLSRTDVEEFRFPADNVATCVKALEARVASLMATANVVLAPMSTKLSTVAAFVVAERHREVQIAYCLPGEYNTQDYSEGATRVFIENVE